MSHVTFEHIKGTANILADHISRLRSMGLYNVSDPDEGKKEFRHFTFDELSPSLLHFNQTRRIGDLHESNTTCIHQTKSLRDKKRRKMTPIILI